MPFRALFASFLFVTLLPFLSFAADSPQTAVPFRAETYGLFQFDQTGDPGSLNPFDPDEASLTAVFAQPDGKSVTVDGFWTQDFDPTEHKTQVGAPHWCVRFCPTQAGLHTFITKLHLGPKVTASSPQTLEVSASQRSGFVHADSHNGMYFTLSTGGAFYPLGVSVAWTGGDRLLSEYERYFKAIGDNGGNLTRVWTCEWNMPLEWTKPGSPPEVGRYRLDSACLLDEVFASARRHGLRIILTLNSYGEILGEKGPWNEQAWARNPYNRANGGPCSGPWDTFTDKEARRMYRNRLRYVSARWGAFPELFSVEFYNEVNVPPDWAGEMVAAFRAHDPYGHLVSNSVGFPWDAPYDEIPLWKIPGLTHVVKHYYGGGDGNADMAEEVRKSSLDQSRRFHKPFFYEELGLDGMKDDAAYDRKGQGTHLHNAFWAAATGLSAAAPLSHWKEYIDQTGLYRELKPLRLFVDSVDWGKADWTPFEAVQTLRNATGGMSGLPIPLDGDWNARVLDKVWVSADGSLEGRLPAFLKTTTRSGGATVMLEVYSPEPVTLVLDVAEVSSGAILKSWIDGHEGPSWTFDPRPGSGDSYLSTRKDEKWNVDVGTYRKDCVLPLPTGRHLLRLENQGADWLRLGSATMAGIHPAAQVKLYGLASDDKVVGWVQDKRDLWRNVYDKGWTPVSVKGVIFPLTRLSSGVWKLTWWDTHNGLTTPSAPLTLHDGKMGLPVPDFKGDIAFTITRLE